MMGFDIMINFNKPYLATNIQDFWNKWHISLSTWVKDYLYTPVFLSLTKFNTQQRLYLSLIITMTLLGLWHGAGWTYVLFGAYHGVLLVTYVILRPKLKKWINPKHVFTRQIWKIFCIVCMFHIVTIGMILFRSQSLNQFIEIIQSVVLNFQLSETVYLETLKQITYYFGVSLVLVSFIQLRGILANSVLLKTKLNGVIAGFLVYFIVFQGATTKSFIYFQF